MGAFLEFHMVRFGNAPCQRTECFYAVIRKALLVYRKGNHHTLERRRYQVTVVLLELSGYARIFIY
jgi:hypothetical protein